MAKQEIKISAEADKESIFVYDRSGKYSEHNKTGFGEPNLKVSDFSRSELIITAPKKNPVTINVYPTFPNDQNYGYEIIAGDLGLPKIISGVWTIERKDYYIPSEGETEILQVKCSFLFDEDVSCCVRNSLFKLDTSNLENPNNQKILDAQRWLETARESAKNGQYENAQKIIAHLSRQCECCL